MFKGHIVHCHEPVGSGRINKDETGMEYLKPDSTLALYFNLSQSPFVPPRDQLQFFEIWPEHIPQ